MSLGYLITPELSPGNSMDLDMAEGNRVKAFHANNLPLREKSSQI